MRSARAAARAPSNARRRPRSWSSAWQNDLLVVSRAPTLAPDVPRRIASSSSRRARGTSGPGTVSPSGRAELRDAREHVLLEPLRRRDGARVDLRVVAEVEEQVG